MRNVLGEQCSCEGYTGRVRDICCISETFAYYYKKARAVYDEDYAYDEKRRSYLAVVGYISGLSNFESELDLIRQGYSGMSSGTVLSVLSKSRQIRETCKICKEPQEDSYSENPYEEVDLG